MRIPLSEVKTIRCRRFNRLICAAQSTVRPAPEDWTFVSLLIMKLVERYGGRIRADDRVAGRPEEGAAIRFTLKKAA